MRAIDVDCEVPGLSETPAGTKIVGPDGPDRLLPPADYGFANYQHIFQKRASAKSEPAVEEAEDESTASKAERAADNIVRLMDEANIEVSILSTVSRTVAVPAVRRHPERLKAFAYLSPYDGMRSVRELERLVREEGLLGLDVGALWDQLPASDRRFYPLYAKCVELDVPVRIYTGMSYANDRPYDLGHPSHVDSVAVDFPELRIAADLSGWPWVNEMVGILRRHPLVYSTTSGHRPRHFATQGSGWEQFLQFGNTLLQDRVMVGMSVASFGLTRSELIAEVLALPLKDAVAEKWLYSNAARFFRIE
ncbi:MAG: amidohydrolase family protein [Streptosporangiaceae bacterium]